MSGRNDIPEAKKPSDYKRNASVVGVQPLKLDDVLASELGQFGRFQLINILMVAIPIMMSALINEYMFSAAAIPHRCRISECGEVNKSSLFEPEWITNAIPPADSSTGFASCSRFQSQGNGTLDYCPSKLFMTTTTDCNGEFVYARDNTVVYEFNLGCEEWLRALAGTLNSIGTLLVLPITGYLSDRFGRRFALVINVFNLGLFGLIRAFSVNYPMYLALQILQTTLGGGAHSTAYIFATEFVGPRYRVVTGASCSALFACGQVLVGAVAWLIRPWRYMIMALHIPCFFIVSYHWLLAESVRWQLSKEKFAEARASLEKVARVNKRQISEKAMNALMTPPPASSTSKYIPSAGRSANGTISGTITSWDARIVSTCEIVEIAGGRWEQINGVTGCEGTSQGKSRVLLRRVFTTPIWWISTVFVYYGLSVNATGLSGSIYLNYILTCAIEIPGFYTAVFILDRIGRKPTLTGGFFFSAVCNVAFILIPQNLRTFRLVVYLLGKFGISCVMTSLYLFTAELYPTKYRHTLVAFSSMVGRIGAVTAPLTPVLMKYWYGVPSAMFAGMAVLSGLLVLTQPETLGTKLPDTLAEAEAVGSPESKRQPRS